MTKNNRYKLIIELFTQYKPFVKTELFYQNPFELLVAVILSAQCTDKRVNMITPGLLKFFPDAESMASADYDAIFQIIKSCSYPNSKAKYLVETSKIIVNKFGGKVPSEIDDLLRLPGVGRKTANVILSVAFDKPAMAVDTHVFRVSGRIGLTSKSRTPASTEKELTSNIPENLLNTAHNWFILHGRYVCLSRKPRCTECIVNSFCLFYQNRLSKKS